MGNSAAPTFVTSATQSRKDKTFLNPMAARLLIDARVVLVPEIGIKLHKPLNIALEFTGSKDFAFRCTQNQEMTNLHQCYDVR